MTRQQLLTAFTVVGIVGAIVGLLGMTFDQPWGGSVSSIFVTIALVGAICLGVLNSTGSAARRSTSS